MYSKEEAKKIKEKFWTTFGQYMSVVPSSDGLKINWVNYKTGVKYLYFRMDVTKKEAFISIEIAHPETSIRLLMFEQLVELKSVLHDNLDEIWCWEQDCENENGKLVSRVIRKIDGVSVFDQSKWPEMISFFKSRIIQLDEFWSLAKYSFEIFK